MGNNSETVDDTRIFGD